MMLYSQSALKAQQAISYGRQQHEMPKQNDPAKTNSKKTDSLKTNSMIARIHNVRPGCGSCGK
jgi:hypothetical protein